MAALLDIEVASSLTDSESGEGIGRVGNLKSLLTLREVALKIKKVFNANGIRFSGNPDEVINKVAFCTGGGGSMVCDAVKSGAQVYISGDIKYDQARLAVSEGMNIIELPHYDSEIIATQLFEKILLDELGDSIEIFITSANKNIYSNIV